MKKNALLIFKSSILFLLLTVFLSLNFSCSNYIEDNDLIKNLENVTSSSNTAAPVASIDTPAFFEGGVPKNRTLIISFTKSMNTKSVWENIIITDSMGKNLKEYFCEPVWSNEDTVVEISPLSENLIDLKKKAFFDIYVTIPSTVIDKDSHPLSNPIDYRYRINDTVDEEAPELTGFRAELPKSYISNKASGTKSTVTILEEGEYNSLNEEKICLTNHINSKLDFYLEGNDYGSGEVWAYFKFSRIYDVQGNAVNEKEFSKLIKLTHLTVSEKYYDTVCFDLSDSRYLDGMYRIKASLVDASGKLSESQNVICVIRDTSFELSPNAAIDFYSESEEQTFTKEQLESFTYIMQFKNTQDDVYFVSPVSGQKKLYANTPKTFTYMLSWGVSLSELCEPVKVSGTQDYIVLPESYRNFRAKNNTKDVYLSASVYDQVGNCQVINAVVPGLIDFFNYEVSEGSAPSYKTIKLNFSDLANSSTDLSDVPDKNNSVSYRIYYGKKESETSSQQLLYTRNVSASGTDCIEFQIEDNSTYSVCIQPVYSSNSKTNGQWSGQTFGPLYELDVDAISSGEDPEMYSFTVSKNSDGPNTGTFTIDVSITKAEKGVSYYPCFSADGINWSTYKELSFKVQNPLKAPVQKGQAWADESLWKDKNFFEVRDSLSDTYQNVKAQIRILAIKGKKAVYSESKDIIFTRDDDNIPPYTSSLVSSHDSMLSFDGRSYKFDGIIREDDFNTKESFKYYYTEYNESWGSNLSCLSEEQILNLPGSTAKLSSKIWTDENGNLQYSHTPVIPVNGLQDGRYMFFAKVYDLYGNEKLITLGKTDINTFKNKLKVFYDSKYNQFNSTLALEENETKFDRNMINIQILQVEQNGAAYAADWKDFYESQNELQDCIVDSQNSILKSSTKNTVEVIDKEYGFKTTKTKNLAKGAFYRLSVQSFNENTYNEQTNRGVNKKNGRPYGEELEASVVVDFVENETEYDLYTQETVSNPVYYYIPLPDEDMSKFKGSFFKNTVAISSNKPVIVNLISSMNNLGSDIDEWERRGKLVKTYYFKGDSSGISFKDNDVREDMLNSEEEGLIYYVMVVHFANNTSEISNVYKLQK